MNLDDLNRTLKGWRQSDGPAATLNSAGEKYIEFGCGLHAREQDVDIIMSVACTKLANAIHTLAARYTPQTHAIEWRKRPECAVGDYPLVVEYRDDGPDMDFVTDRRCVMDKGFKLVKTYARISFVPIAD